MSLSNVLVVLPSYLLSYLVLISASEVLEASMCCRLLYVLVAQYVECCMFHVSHR